MSDVETTDKYKNTKQVIITCLEIMSKVGRKWKYRVKDKNTNDVFILQTTIEPRDLPVTMKVGKDYIFPVEMNKVGKVGNVPEDPTIDYSVLIQDFEVPSSTIPVVEQAKLETVECKHPVNYVTQEGLVCEYCRVVQVSPKPPANDKPLVHSEDIGGGRVSTKEGSQLAVTEPKDQYQLMDQRDEDQIIDEIKGRMIDEYVYQFDVDIKDKQGNKIGVRTVTGVSYAGIKALVTGRGGYSITTNTIVEVNGIWYAKVIIHDNIKDLDGLGMGECPLQESFARQKAMGKALRNAYRSAMDEGRFKAFCLQWLKENKK